LSPRGRARLTVINPSLLPPGTGLLVGRARAAPRGLVYAPYACGEVAATATPTRTQRRATPALSVVMADTKPNYMVLIGKEVCPTAELHDPEVELGISEVSFSEWARQKARAHRVKKCQGCGLWKVWEAK